MLHRTHIHVVRLTEHTDAGRHQSRSTASIAVQAKVTAGLIHIGINRYRYLTDVRPWRSGDRSRVIVDGAVDQFGLSGDCKSCAATTALICGQAIHSSYVIH